jgi:hypothetical protein
MYLQYSTGTGKENQNGLELNEHISLWFMLLLIISRAKHTSKCHKKNQ